MHFPATGYIGEVPGFVTLNPDSPVGVGADHPLRRYRRRYAGRLETAFILEVGPPALEFPFG
jgi:hypothetical protein